MDQGVLMPSGSPSILSSHVWRAAGGALGSWLLAALAALPIGPLPAQALLSVRVPGVLSPANLPPVAGPALLWTAEPDDLADYERDDRDDLDDPTDHLLQTSAQPLIPAPGTLALTLECAGLAHGLRLRDPNIRSRPPPRTYTLDLSA
jgi:hypothetical protein